MTARKQQRHSKEQYPTTAGQGRIFYKLVDVPGKEVVGSMAHALTKTVENVFYASSAPDFFNHVKNVSETQPYDATRLNTEGRPDLQEL